MFARIASWFKSSSVAPLIFGRFGQSAVWTGVTYAEMTREAYQKNATAYRAVDLVAKSVARVPIRLRRQSDGVEITSHPLLTLLKRPNPTMSGSTFTQNVTAYYQLTGNTYIETVGPSLGGELPWTTPPTELWPLRPDRMKVLPGPYGVAGYKYSVGGSSKSWMADQTNGNSNVIHVKAFNPLDDWYGMSPLQACMMQVDQSNSASVWNKRTLDNSGKPDGQFVAEGTLTDPQYERIMKRVSEKYAGPNNAGRPLVLESGLTWQSTGFSPKDMDWLNGLHTTSRQISMTLGVPPMLLSIPGDNTYSNYKEARVALYEETCIPLLDLILDEYNGRLVPRFDPGLELYFHEDDIPAMATAKAERWQAVSNSTFLTTNEKRAALGWAPHVSADNAAPEDMILVPSGVAPLTDVAAALPPAEPPTPEAAP